MAPTPVALDATAASLPEFWSQAVVGEANGSVYRVAKGTGSTEWHSHANQDEVFVVTRGELVIELRSGDVRVGEGELFIVPRDTEHRPRVEHGEAHFLIVGTTITSNAEGGKPSWSAAGGVPPAP